MEGLELWRLRDLLTVHEAAMLVVGTDPSGEARPTGYEAVKGAILSAVLNDQIEGNVVSDFGDIDVHRTEIVVASLRTWLKRRGIGNGFFFPEETAGLDFLDPKNPRYARKLAATVFAWRGTGDPAAHSREIAKGSTQGLASRTRKRIWSAQKEWKAKRRGD